MNNALPSKANDTGCAQVAAVVAALPALRAAVGAGGCGARLDVRADRDGGRVIYHGPVVCAGCGAKRVFESVFVGEG
jgi:hypothetical protein